MSNRYQLTLAAQNIPTRFFCRPSPYAKVTVTGGPNNGQVIGTTSVIKKSRNPDWTDSLYVLTDPSIYMPLKIEIWNDSGIGKPEFDTLLGDVTMEATEIFQHTGRTKTGNLRGGGTVTACMEESIKGSVFGTVSLHIRGLDVKNVEPGPFGLGRTDPLFEIAKKNIDPTTGVSRWNSAYRSEHILNHLNPYWEPFDLTIEELCYCDLDWPLRITLCDYQGDGINRFVGYFETTLRSLRQKVSLRGNADRIRAFEVKRDAETGGSAGLIVVVKCDLRSYEGEEIVLANDDLKESSP